MKKKEFNNEVKSLSATELQAKARGIAEELMKLRFRNATGQFENGHRFDELKRNLARIKVQLPKVASKGAA